MEKKTPWSIKGITPEARSAAKSAANAAGLSIGDWLTSLIDSTADTPTAAAITTETQEGESAPARDIDLELLNELTRRVKHTEQRLADGLSKLYKALDSLSSRLNLIDQAQVESTYVSPKEIQQGNN